MIITELIGYLKSLDTRSQDTAKIKADMAILRLTNLSYKDSL
jgi:hypothetical protein